MDPIDIKENNIKDTPNNVSLGSVAQKISEMIQNQEINLSDLIKNPISYRFTDDEAVLITNSPELVEISQINDSANLVNRLGELGGGVRDEIVKEGFKNISDDLNSRKNKQGVSIDDLRKKPNANSDSDSSKSFGNQSETTNESEYNPNEGFDATPSTTVPTPQDDQTSLNNVQGVSKDVDLPQPSPTGGQTQNDIYSEDTIESDQPSTNNDENINSDMSQTSGPIAPAPVVDSNDLQTGDKVDLNENNNDNNLVDPVLSDNQSISTDPLGKINDEIEQPKDLDGDDSISIEPGNQSEVTNNAQKNNFIKNDIDEVKPDAEKTKLDSSKSNTDNGLLAGKKPEDIKPLNLSDRDTSATSKISPQLPETAQSTSAGSIDTGRSGIKPVTKLPQNKIADGGGEIDAKNLPENVRELPKKSGGKLDKAKQIAYAAKDPEQAAKTYAKKAATDQAKKLAIQAANAIWAWIAPALPWIIGFVFLFVTFFTIFVGVVLWAYCFEQGKIRDTIEAALNVAEGDAVGAAVNVTGVGLTSKSELREYLEQEGGICKTVNPDFCGVQGSVSGDGSVDNGVGVDGVGCFAAPRSGLMADPYYRALGRALRFFENSDSYQNNNPNELSCYGAYQFCPFGAWGEAVEYIQNNQSDFPGINSMPNLPSQATPVQQDAAFIAYFNVRFPSGIQSLKNAGENTSQISQIMETQRWCQGWTPFGSNSGSPGGCPANEGKRERLIPLYLKLLPEEKAGRCGQGSEDLNEANKNITLIDRFERAFSGYKETDNIDLLGIISGNIEVEAMPGSFTYNGEDATVKEMLNSGKIRDVITQISASRGTFANQIDRRVIEPNTLKAIISVVNSGKFDFIRISSAYRAGDNVTSGHGSGQKVDFDAIGFQGQTYTHQSGNDGNQAAIDAWAEFARTLNDTGVLIHIISGGGIYRKISADPELSSVKIVQDDSSVPRYGAIHENHYDVRFDPGGNVVAAGGSISSSTGGGNCVPCGSQNGSSASIPGDLAGKISRIEELINTGKLTLAAKEYNLNALKNGWVNEKTIDTVITIASSDQFENINIISWYRDTAFSGLADESFYDNNKNNRAIDVGSIKKNGTTYDHLQIHQGGGPSNGVDVWVEFSQLLKNTGNVKQIITDSPFTSRLRSISGFTAGSGQGTTANIRIAEAPGHENHFHIDIDVPSASGSNFELKNLFSIDANAEFGTKPSSYDNLTDGHKDFLKEIADERGYIGYKDAGKESSEMRTAINDLIARASQDGISLKAVSVYRSYDDQVGTYFSKINRFWSDNLTPSETVEVRNDYLTRAQVSAPPGFSEHSTGLAVDFASDTAGLGASNELEASTYPAQLTQFLEQNAPEFGFELSYPQGSTEGAGYEPWHWRFIGNEKYPNSTLLDSFRTSGGSDSSNCSGVGGGIPVGDGEFIVPSDGVFTSPYGNRVHPITGQVRLHAGVDIGAPIGTPIFASAAGKAKLKPNNGGAGNEIILTHEGGVETRYLHLNKFNVSDGQVVNKGEQIAEMGTTGNSTGSHLHFEFYPNGFNARGAIDPCTKIKCPGSRGTFKAKE